MCINYIILHKKVKMISVIVPVYRVEKYLKRCVDSILQQTYENIEIILVDDGSPDQSGKICDDIARIDSRVRVIHKKNGGLSSARNAALEIINGDYVSFVDSDDLIHPQMFELLLNKMLENNSDVVCTGLRNFSSTNVVFNNMSIYMLKSSYMTPSGNRIFSNTERLNIFPHEVTDIFPKFSGYK